LDGDQWKFTTFPTFTTSFVIATTTTIDTRRVTGYWTLDGESGNTTFFCIVETVRTTGTN